MENDSEVQLIRIFLTLKNGFVKIEHIILTNILYSLDTL